MSPTPSVASLPIATQHAPFRVVYPEPIERILQLRKPVFRKDNILVAKNDEVINTAADCIVVGFRRGAEIFLDDYLVTMRVA
jgi:hypothetical protein